MTDHILRTVNDMGDIGGSGTVFCHGAIFVAGEAHMGHLFAELLQNEVPVEDLAAKYQGIVEQLIEENPEPDM
jgi:hypothetical protein